MATPGDGLRNVWTADLYNRLAALLYANGGGGPLTVSGQASLAKTGKGLQLTVPQPRQAVSTIQGYLVGGSAPAVSNGTETVDPYAWAAYSIQSAYFKLTAGTCSVTVAVNGTPVSWLNSLSITTSATVVSIAVPVPNLTHVVPVGAALTIQVSSASSATGLVWSLNTPF